VKVLNTGKYLVISLLLTPSFLNKILIKILHCMGTPRNSIYIMQLLQSKKIVSI
jgi:hypothetical protein